MAQALLMEQVAAPFILGDISLDTPLDREVKVQVRASGVCHSDLTASTHDMGLELPAVFGHEISGIVAEVGKEVTRFQPGDQVIACLQAHCGECPDCIDGQINLCKHRDAVARDPGQPPRLTWNGRPVTQNMDLAGFAEEILVHQNNLVKLDEPVEHEVACILGCGVITGAGAVIEGSRIRPFSTVAVVGCGGVGLSAIAAARFAGAAQVIALDVVDSKLELAREMGATHVVNSAQTDPVQAVRELSGGGVTNVFDVAGIPAVTAQSYDMVAQGGEMAIVGMSAPGSTWSLDIGPEALFRQATIRPVLMGNSNFKRDIPRYADLYRQGRFNLDALVSRTINLSEVNGAFDDMAVHPGRTVVVFD
ncbi:zinc-binding dehydrogenase [Citricoccus sp. GCM10030269]|uniref:zinc-binding dehydrogenase n=1 Tax=Citricoccus sp. GCM10030269 TaxID=3273388 RepID=UPI003619CB95